MAKNKSKLPLDDNRIRTLVENMLVPHTAYVGIITQLEQGLRVAPALRDSIGYFIAGDSRTGKSRASEEFAAEHPPYRTDEGLIVPVLRVEVPSNPSSKGLAAEILTAFGDPAASKGTEWDRNNRVAFLLNRCKTKMLIIDEIQHFIDKTDNYKVLLKLTDSLKSIMNHTKIVVAVAGLPYAEPILTQNEQLLGRFIKTMHMPRFDWKDDVLRGEFLGVLEGLSELLQDQVDLPDLGSEEIAYRFYLATGGLIGYVINILRKSIWNVLDEGRTTITIDDIDSTYQGMPFVLNRYPISPFSMDFDMTESQNLAKAAQIGVRPIDHRNARGYKPATTREALA